MICSSIYQYVIITGRAVYSVKYGVKNMLYVIIYRIFYIPCNITNCITAYRRYSKQYISYYNILYNKLFYLKIYHAI